MIRGSKLSEFIASKKQKMLLLGYDEAQATELAESGYCALIVSEADVYQGGDPTKRYAPVGKVKA